MPVVWPFCLGMDRFLVQQPSRRGGGGPPLPPSARHVRGPSNIRKLPRKPVVSSTVGKPGTKNGCSSVSSRLQKMAEGGLIFENKPLPHFVHDVNLEAGTRDLWDLPFWQRDVYATNPVVAEGTQWFRGLDQRHKDNLRNVTSAVSLKYQNTGCRFSSEHGYYFLHAGGALARISGAKLPEGTPVSGCPCGNLHHKPI